MTDRLKFDIKPLETLSSRDANVRDVVILVGENLLASPESVALLGAGLTDSLRIAGSIERFTGKLGQGFSLLAPSGLSAERVIVVGAGSPSDRTGPDLFKLGATILSRLSVERQAGVILSLDGEVLSSEQMADIALGMRLRAYVFDTYKTKKKEDEEPKGAYQITLHSDHSSSLKKSLKSRDGLAEGIYLARTLVNEPPNVLTPEVFAERAQNLHHQGVEIDVLDEKAIKKIGMRALLAVGQGSHNESRVVVMRWMGGKEGEAPIAIIGKGVTFDSGGISIKPADKMEDMKGDMAGAACVVGLMHALSLRKANANVIGIIGLVENMPDGKAQRPGDIVTSMSGQTIEIINTDAEGRLVLGDLLTYVQERYSPAKMVDLATLTGAILVALGNEHAGLFSNNDDLANALTGSGKATGETVWRMPLGASYDKLIDSKFADMKNTGGRYAGSITAAQFLQRFVNAGTPWAHLDIAGTGMGAPESDINKSWGSGWGVRLLTHWIEG